MTDVAIVGGGLAGGALAWFLAERRPELSVRLLESGLTLGGDHTWSFHESDLAPSELSAIRPWVTRRWASQEVAFPSYRRSFGTAYASIRSSTFDAALRSRLGARVETGVTVDALESIEAACVIDARSAQVAAGGYQKFVGIDVELETPHGLDRPLLMDATVEQLDGFRFIYVLPWGERTLLIEDTRYSDSAAIDVEALADAIFAYAAKRGWKVKGVLRSEKAALPIPLTSNDPDPSCAAARIGVGGGFFHPTTGYSVPDAVRIAALLASLPVLTTATARAALADYASRGASRRAFYLRLNRMLFGAAEPAERYRVLQRFYRLPEGVIGRFYAGQSTWTDRFRILAGRPPVPVVRALRALMFPRTQESP
jgi:lycopene beta-cyclase